MPAFVDLPAPRHDGRLELLPNVEPQTICKQDDTPTFDARTFSEPSTSCVYRPAWQWLLVDKYLEAPGCILQPGTIHGTYRRTHRFHVFMRFHAGQALQHCRISTPAPFCVRPCHSLWR